MRFEQLRYDDLRDLCRQRGLRGLSGSRTELLDRLIADSDPVRETQERDAMAGESGNVLLLEQDAADDKAVREALAAPVEVPNFAKPLHNHISTFRHCPPPPLWEGAAEDELFRHIREQCSQGEWIWCLAARRDVATLGNVFGVLRQKGFNVAVSLVLCGFLHILYWHQSISMALALILAHPVLCPTELADLDLEAWAGAIESIMHDVSETFKDLRVVRGQLVRKPVVKKTGAVLADRNPCCWNRSSVVDVGMFAADLRAGAVTDSCKELAEMFLEGRFDYGKGLRLLQSKKNRYYTGLEKSYISVHFLRCMRVAVGVPAPPGPSDFRILLKMGGGVRRWGWSDQQAAEAIRVILTHAPSSDYQMDDLACLMCLAGH